MKKINHSEIIKVCNEELSMLVAARKVNLPYTTFVRMAKKLGVYKPNMGGKGMPGHIPNNYILLENILNGNNPEYQTNKLRIRLIKENIKNEQCEICGITEWNNKKVSFELHHIDGNSKNHKIENLMIVCPNCHSQTETYRCRKRK